MFEYAKHHRSKGVAKHTMKHTYESHNDDARDTCFMRKEFDIILCVKRAKECRATNDDVPSKAYKHSAVVGDELFELWKKIWT